MTTPSSRPAITSTVSAISRHSSSTPATPTMAGRTMRKGRACSRATAVSAIGVRRQAVAQAAHRLDQVLRIDRHQGLAQPQDVNVDGALLDEDMVAPDVVEQLAAREHALRMADEKGQQLEFG